MGFFTELGPMLFNLQSRPGARNGGQWRPFTNPYSWSTVGSLLVWEQPAGVGFSRCAHSCPLPWNDTTSATANLHILRAFFDAYPTERARELMITGESYGGIYVPLLAQRVIHDATLRAAGVRLRAIAVGDGCIGYAVSGGCGSDALDVFVSVLERVAPGVSRSALAGVRAGCTAAELTSGRQPGELSAKCATALKRLFTEVGEYNEYHWASPCGPDGQGNWGDGSAFACATGVLPAYLAEPAAQRALNVISAGAYRRRLHRLPRSSRRVCVRVCACAPVCLCACARMCVRAWWQARHRSRGSNGTAMTQSITSQKLTRSQCTVPCCTAVCVFSSTRD